MQKMQGFNAIGGRKGKRLKGLDEFETPEFVGRMGRVQRRRRLLLGGQIFLMLVLGAMLGWWLG